MLSRFLVLIFIGFLLSGCHRQAVATEQQPGAVATVRSTQVRSVPSFNHVIARGRLNVDLHTGYSKPQVILRGAASDLQQVVTKVQNGQLLIQIGEGYPRCGAVSVEVRGHYLNSFTYQGGGVITGSRLHSGLLDLSIDNPGNTTLGGDIFLRKLDVRGSGNVQISGVHAHYLQLSMRGKPHVQLTGMANLSMVELAGEGWFSMYWIKSDKLKIRAKNKAFMQLAGIANVIDVELWGNAQFKGRYLRANRAFVKTHDRAVAELSAVKRQHTLASDASDIYFYNLPEMRTDFMAYNGAVLDMRDWGYYSIQEYTRYNKSLNN
ncbi:hypothetical protein Lrub_1578 [Legionella rubrilucens]|uniref:Putative auto-transporter adhesin head GIN domain-containing protein n=1 Tax=Legionella rubrilucens TaxID=458 RepID=A0A0W0XQL2_9GAMM|nr:DUF2807 domain-containing protein [Legionella rubrilucens]KTD46656.1 hypothetical protein Lrub_1578 [Legionella rubrilucens]